MKNRKYSAYPEAVVSPFTKGDKEIKWTARIYQMQKQDPERHPRMPGIPDKVVEEFFGSVPLASDSREDVKTAQSKARIDALKSIDGLVENYPNENYVASQDANNVVEVN